MYGSKPLHMSCNANRCVPDDIGQMTFLWSNTNQSSFILMSAKNIQSLILQNSYCSQWRIYFKCNVSQPSLFLPLTHTQTEEYTLSSSLMKLVLKWMWQKRKVEQNNIKPEDGGNLGTRRQVPLDRTFHLAERTDLHLKIPVFSCYSFSLSVLKNRRKCSNADEDYKWNSSI